MRDKQRIAIKGGIKELRKAINVGNLQGKDRVEAERTISIASGKLMSFCLPMVGAEKP